MACGSTTASAGGAWQNVKDGSPGVPTSPANDYYYPDSCDERWSKDDCIEQCIEKEISKPTRPWYAVGPKGTDCQEYTWDVVQTCERRCGRR